MGERNESEWWKEKIIYQIYPRSFNDANGDGIGDLRGIIEKLDYLKDLGVDIIWICPIYQSPNDDNGYDISDYRSIHPEFGSLADLEALLAGLHARGMKLIMDLVVNHTSDEHEFFKASKSSIDNPYRDYYIWKKPAEDGGPPNNWMSFFGGSAWEFDEASGEYYLHLFTKKQPDLNWENPKVRNEMHDILNFWLDKGIDGFRMDVVPLISKRTDYPDAYQESFPKVIEQVYSNGPKVHDYIKEMVAESIANYDVMTVGEGPGINKEVALNYVGKNEGELNLIFHLDHMYLGQGKEGKYTPVPYNLSDVKRIFNEWDEAIGSEGWISIFLDNHDFPRMISRFGNDEEFRVECAKLFCMLILTLRGTACIYQGSEIGMTNVAFQSMDDYRDVETLNFYKEQQKLGISEEEFLIMAHEHGRDNARTPMQWNTHKNAGFSSCDRCWIDVNPNYKLINVEASKHDPNSILSFYKEMIKFRKDNNTFVYGQYEELSKGHDNLFIYKRWDTEHTFIVCLNLSEEVVDITDYITSDVDCVISNYGDNNPEQLSAWQAKLFKTI